MKGIILISKVVECDFQGEHQQRYFNRLFHLFSGIVSILVLGIMSSILAPIIVKLLLLKFSHI